MKSHAIFRPGKTLGSVDKAEQSRSAGGTARVAPQPFVTNYLPALIAQVHALVAGDFHRTAATHGCAAAEWRVLATLAEGEPMSIGRLAEIVVMKQPTLTRVLDRMVLTGQVQRVRHPGDRRVILVNITPAGRRIARELLPLARAREAQFLQAIDPRRAVDMKAALQQLVASQRCETQA